MSKLWCLILTANNAVIRISAPRLFALLIFILFPSSSWAQSSNEVTTPGQVYETEVFKDWKILCVFTGREEDPCHMYQLIRDASGHPTAEIAIQRVFDQEGIAGAAMVLTPLETLLTANLRFEYDKNTSSMYPFSWCHKRGCNVRIALTDDDVLSMKTGRSGKIILETISNPGNPLELPVSYQGFTAAFGSLQE